MVPLTSQLAALRFPATVRIDPSPENGLTMPSVAMVFQIRALDRTRFIRRLGAVSDSDLAAILAALNRLTGQTV
jgi:mRNA interferase MazF